ncbi:UvrD-helicase domain-containing protein [Salipiger mucosus]|uniref:DNA 3'-5' helicase n=1 Tax=Salipiger mucosus DSM 16094 TaxID=1123237 RepID=S9Q5Y8_9RHOB|nr:UvrD-helicase domain-containing protein [Salipiger mucosus]EPX76801.1 DNA helicase IV [Salipiger mucosus DSM 16094]
MSFIENHIQRCQSVIDTKSGLAPVVKKMRAVIAQQEDDKQAAILRKISSRERKPFTEAAAAAIDRNLPARPGGTPASQLPENKSLLDFVSLVSPSIRLRARAGSGKSTGLVIKIDFLVNTLGVPPEAIQLLTFNKAAANDLSNKLEASLGDVGRRVGVNTFHSLAFHVLKTYPGTRGMVLDFTDDARANPAKLSDIESAVMENTTRQDLAAYRNRYENSAFKFLVKQPDFEDQVREFIASGVSLYRARRGTPGQRDVSPIFRHLKRVAGSFDAKLAESETFDGEAGLREAARILSSDNTIPGFTRLNGSLQFLFVDEYQDFSAAFEQLVAGVMHRNPDAVLNAVGDDWQSINAFMGADLSFFRGFRSRYEAALNLPLQTNWRCGKRIVEMGNEVMEASNKERAVAGLPHDGRVRVKTGGIKTERRKTQEWHEEARAFLEDQIAIMAKRAWDDDARAGRDPGSLVLLASKNRPFGRDLKTYARRIKAPEGVTVASCTSHASKGREWDHVIILDGIEGEYPGGHPAQLVARDMLSKADMREEGQRLLYVAVTRAKHSLAVLAPTKLHRNLYGARLLANELVDA